MNTPLLNSLVELFDTRTGFEYDRAELSTILEVCQSIAHWSANIEQKLFWLNLHAAIQNEIVLDTLQKSEKITVS